MYGSLTVGSPHVMERDCSADPGIWSDLHLQRSYRSEYSHGRYAWIRGTSSKPHPSRFLQLEHTPSRGPSTPITSASHGEGLTADSPPVDSGTEGPSTTGSYAVSPEVTSPTATGSSDGQPATPYQQAVQPPVKPKGRGVTFDTPTDKAAAVGSQDTDSCGRQKTHDRDNKTQPTNPGRGVHERSSVRTIDKQMLHQAPSGATHDAPRDSTPGSTSQQCSSSTRAPRDPLKWVSQFGAKDGRKTWNAYSGHTMSTISPPLGRLGGTKSRTRFLITFSHTRRSGEE